jgi:hypothetical protein
MKWFHKKPTIIVTVELKEQRVNVSVKNFEYSSDVLLALEYALDAYDQGVEELEKKNITFKNITRK